MPGSDYLQIYLIKPQQISGKYPLTLVYETQRTGFDQRPCRPLLHTLPLYHVSVCEREEGVES